MTPKIHWTTAKVKIGIKNFDKQSTWNVFVNNSMTWIVPERITQHFGVFNTIANIEIWMRKRKKRGQVPSYYCAHE